MKLRTQLALAAVLAAVLAPSAFGSPAADLAAVSTDYSRDSKVTPCRFTKAQLEAARSQIGADVDTYAKGLGNAIRKELKRWKDGACKGRSAVGSLKIVAIKAAGDAGTESVTIKNVTKKAIDLRGYALRDAGDHTLKFRKTTLKAGRKLKVITGCREGHRSAVRRGTSYYTCRKNEVWDDAGDVVELLGRGGGLVATKTY